MGLIAKGNLSAALAHLKELPFCYLCLHYPLCYRLTADVLAKLKQDKTHLSAWTVNTVEDAAKLKDLGVDSLISDYPTRLLQQLFEER